MRVFIVLFSGHNNCIKINIRNDNCLFSKPNKHETDLPRGKRQLQILKKANNQCIFPFLSKFAGINISGWKKRKSFIRN